MCSAANLQHTLIKSFAPICDIAFRRKRNYWPQGKKDGSKKIDFEMFFGSEKSSVQTFYADHGS